MAIENENTGAEADKDSKAPPKASPGTGTDKGTETVEDDDEGDGRHDQHLAKTRKERDAYKAKLREKETKLAEYERKEREAAEAAERSAGDFKSLESRYQTKIRGLEEELGALKSEREATLTRERRTAFVDAIAEEGKLSNRKVIAALLPTLDDVEDTAPEHFTSGDVKRALKSLKTSAPELFSTTNPTIKPPPGSGQRPPDRNDPDYYRNLAKAYSTGQTGADAYSKVTGRSR